MKEDLAMKLSTVFAAMLCLGLAGCSGSLSFVKKGPARVHKCQIIDQSGSYVVKRNLTAEPDGDCLVVTADHVTIDLDGFSIMGNGVGNGILLSGPRKDVEVRGGTLRDFDGDGISAPDPANQGHRIIAVRADSNSSDGIFLAGSGHLVRDCTAVGNGSVQTVAGNDGIKIGAGSTATGNTAEGNARHGVDAGLGSTVTGNTARSNQRGIATGDGATVTGNTAASNVVGIDAASNSTITGNSAFDNTTGINVNYYNLVEGNSVTQNNPEGITTLGDFNVFQGNLLAGHNNGANDAGITLGAASNNNYCNNNRFSDNSQSVRDLSGGSNPACTGNTAF